MTSKEALNLLKTRIICAKGEKEFDLLYKKYYEEIERDLAALEILKNHIDVDELKYLYKGEPIFVYYINLLQKNLTKEEYDLLKEWLENDKISKNNN